MFIKAKLNVGNSANRATSAFERDITFDASEVSDWSSSNNNPDVTILTFKNGKEVSIMCKAEHFLGHLNIVKTTKRDIEIALDGTRKDFK